MEEFRFEHLNKNSHLPYYVQIKYYLRHLIKELGPNALIPSETELADLFGVSRGTAKQAIMDLVYEGALYRRHGRVSAPEVFRLSPRSQSQGLFRVS